MATIVWSVGDFFTSSDPQNPTRKIYGVVTAPMKWRCVLVVDTGLRTDRHVIASASIPEDATPMRMKDIDRVDYAIRMALYGVFVASIEGYRAHM